MNRKIIFSRMRRSYFFVMGLVCLVLVIAACYVLPIFIVHDPVTNVLENRFMRPEGFSRGFEGHVLGTDQLGRDVFSRLAIGGQYSIRLAIIVVFLQFAIGTVLGLTSGYFGRWVDTVIMRACDVMMTMPTLILAIAVLAILGSNDRNLIIVMAISGWVQICKVTRNNVSIVKQQEFVLASKALGAKKPHIMFRQIFPNVTTQIIVITSQRMGLVILMESQLSFLGLGIQIPAPSWGNMISAGRQYLATQPWLIVVPGIALMLAVLSFNFMGDGLRDVFDTKRKV